MILTIARKEFRSLLALPSTWLILGGLQFMFAWFFLARLDVFLQVQAQLAQSANAPGATLADRKSTRLNSSHLEQSRMPSSA